MRGFRLATEADVEAIIDMTHSYYMEDGYPFVESESRRALVELILDENLGRLWVAQDSDGVVGYLAVTLGYSLEYQGRDAFIDELFIAKRSRGAGDRGAEHRVSLRGALRNTEQGGSTQRAEEEDS